MRQAKHSRLEKRDGPFLRRLSLFRGIDLVEIVYKSALKKDRF